MGLLSMGLGDLVKGIGSIADDLFTSDEERLKIALEEKRIDAALVQGQLEINKTEAAHKSVFVAGWRPFMGWVGGAAMAYQFILHPLLVWIWSLLQARGFIPSGLDAPPVLAAQELWVVVSGMLGIGGMRSFDKIKGKETVKVGG